MWTANYMEYTILVRSFFFVGEILLNEIIEADKNTYNTHWTNIERIKTLDKTIGTHNRFIDWSAALYKPPPSTNQHSKKKRKKQTNGCYYTSIDFIWKFNDNQCLTIITDHTNDTHTVFGSLGYPFFSFFFFGWSNRLIRKCNKGK